MCAVICGMIIKFKCSSFDVVNYESGMARKRGHLEKMKIKLHLPYIRHRSMIRIS